MSRLGACALSGVVLDPQGIVVAGVLQAIPFDADQRFVGWSGCTSVSGATCTVSMSTARTVYATFASP